MPKAFGFSPLRRLIKQAQFQTVFQKRKRLFSPYCIIYYCPNQLANARIGIVASKRNMRLAIQRNRFKRIVRETFRLEQAALAGLDLIAVAKQSANDATNEKLHQCLQKLLKQLIKQRASFSSD